MAGRVNKCLCCAKETWTTPKRQLDKRDSRDANDLTSLAIQSDR